MRVITESQKKSGDDWKREGKKEMSFAMEKLMNFVQTVPEHYRFFVRLSLFEHVMNEMLFELIADKITSEAEEQNT